MLLVWFDLLNRKVQRELIESQVRIEGIRFDVDKIRNVESFFEWHIKKQGKYRIIHLPPRPENVEEVVAILKIFGYTEESTNALLEAGIPDFLLYNEKDYLFVEVKSSLDGIHYTQIRWMLRHRVPHRFIWVMLNSEVPKDWGHGAKITSDTEELPSSQFNLIMGEGYSGV